jgi:Myb/SANT-like DNA-binding protein
MPIKSTRVRKPSNREPTSLAITPTPIPSSSDLRRTELVDPMLLKTTELDTIEYQYPGPPQPNLNLSRASSSLSHVGLETSQLEQTQSTREVSRLESNYSATTGGDTTGLVVADDTTPAVDGKITWTFKMEEALVNELVQQVEQGKRADSGYKKEAWAAAITQVEHATSRVVTLEQCKNKIDTMKGHWRLFNWLKEQSGFGYNDETGLIEAPHNVWENAIKVSL